MKVFKKGLSLFLLIVMVISLSFVGQVTSYAKDKAVEEESLEYLKSYLDEAKVSRVDEGRVQGFLIEPQDKIHDGLVIAFTGSDGSYDFDSARTLGEEGYTVLLASYFGKDNLPKDIHRIPVDEIMDDILDFAKKEDLDIKPLTLIGTSRGTEFVQIIANNYKEVNNLVLIAPFSVAMPYFYRGSKFSPSWMYKKKIIPYFNNTKVDRDIYKKIFLDEKKEEDLEYRILYENMFNNTKKDPPKLSLDDFKGKILILTGEDDRIAPTEIMAKEIYDRYKKQVELHIFKDAGHAFTQSEKIGGYQNGGTKDGNREAYYEAKQYLIDFMEENHSNN